jgi:glycerophosphoryl diester phosphodiesterase
MRTKPSWLLDRPIAHRGLHDGGPRLPENSLAAVAAAADAGYAIEFDVRLSQDDEVMVFHDRELSRMTGADGPVRVRSRDELTKLRLLDGSEPLPTLADLLDLVDGRVPLLVELKKLGEPDSALEPATWRLLSTYRGPFTVQSFEPMSIAWFAKNAPEAIRGQIARKFAPDDAEAGPSRGAMLQRLMFAYAGRPDYIVYKVRDLPYAPVAAARARGVPIIGYTVMSRQQALALRPLLDNMIFEGFIPEKGPYQA